MSEDKQPQRRRRSVIPTTVIIVGLIVGLVGLVMTVLGIGGVSPTHLSFSNSVSVQTTSSGIVVMLVGFGMSTFLLYSMIRVDILFAKIGQRYREDDTYVGEEVAAALGFTSEQRAGIVGGVPLGDTSAESNATSDSE